MPTRITINDIQDMKQRGEKIPMLTAFDYTSAKLLDSAGIPVVLVGDSLGQVVLGYRSTVRVTIDHMLHHVKAVYRGAKTAHIVGDLPFMSYQADVSDAIRNAGRMLQEGGAQSVKLEGGRRVAETVRRLVEIGIPGMGHIGLTPQSVNQTGGYRVQGRTEDQARDLLDDAAALQDAGAYAVVLELVPADLAAKITAQLAIPTIGIGSGVHCDGQVQVFHDILGLLTERPRKHTKLYANLSETIIDAVRSYSDDVQKSEFPTDEQSF